MGANKPATPAKTCFEINRAHGALLPAFSANDKRDLWQADCN
jgi:hypothetical protein